MNSRVINSAVIDNPVIDNPVIDNTLIWKHRDLETPWRLPLRRVWCAPAPHCTASSVPHRPRLYVVGSHSANDSVAGLLLTCRWWGSARIGLLRDRANSTSRWASGKM